MNIFPLSIKSLLSGILLIALVLTSITDGAQKENHSKSPQVLVPDELKQLEDFNLSYAQRQQRAMSIYKETGVLPWTPLSPQERQLRLADQLTTIKEYIKVFPRLKYHETRYFLFVSDAPDNVYREIASLMDKMYEVLCNVYNIPYEYEMPDGTILPIHTRPLPAEAKKVRHNIWQSKCTVVVFMNPKDYTRFELMFYKKQVPDNLLGLCHLLTNGVVTISCKSAANKYDFYETLVHETTHGFTFMYKTINQLPLWLDEGMADWAARKLVPLGTEGLAKQKEAVRIMQRTRSVGDLFSQQNVLEPWQYGASAMIVNMLLKKNPKNFVKLIEAIKHGEAPEHALQRLYKVNYAGLANALGRINGIPNVRMER